MSKTKIPWVLRRDGRLGEVINPVVGCTAVSAGCKNCWARKLHNGRHRSRITGGKLPDQYLQPFSSVQLFADRLDAPMRRRAPSAFFWCSTSDLFHADVEAEFIERSFGVMRDTPRHLHYVLTKRVRRAAMFLDPNLRSDVYADLPLPNVYVGASVEDQATADERLPLLVRIPALRFVSVEPQLGPVSLAKWIHQVDWVIVGAESDGMKAGRPFDRDWARTLRDECVAAGVPFWFKQDQDFGALVHRPVLDGKRWRQHPERP